MYKGLLMLMDVIIIVIITLCQTHWVFATSQQLQEVSINPISYLQGDLLREIE